jgi:cell fate regulator YaaT (PSP1 superfamily)
MPNVASSAPPEVRSDSDLILNEVSAKAPALRAWFNRQSFENRQVILHLIDVTYTLGRVDVLGEQLDGGR